MTFAQAAQPLACLRLLPLWIALLLCACGREGSLPPTQTRPETNSSRSGRLNPELAAQVARLETRERELNETVWAKEKLAETTGRVVEDLWDSVNRATNKLSVLASFPVGNVLLATWTATNPLPHGILLREPNAPHRALTSDQWGDWVDTFARDGWQIDNLEFRHRQFDVDTSGAPAQSVFYFAANLTNSLHADRATMDGDLVITWTHAAPEPKAAVAQVDATRLRLKARAGPLPFRPILAERISQRRNSRSVDPLLVYDLDADGHPEIILAAANRVYRSRDGLHFEAEPLCKFPPDVVYAAVIADFDGDGFPDFLCDSVEGLLLFQGSPGGTFDAPGRLVWPAPRDLKYVMAMTCGDVDGDGALDVFLAQYKLPYEGGQMATPYYNANDGYPAYLLRNDGHGTFTDVTTSAGLAQKRWRRSYGCALVDLDQDGHLDLVVASDFAGIDVYRNDGAGHFADLTSRWLPESHAFGMGLCLADFNRDGRLDLLLTGMPSATVDLLEHLGLWRPGSTEDRRMRTRMAAGNRLYLGHEGSGFDDSPMGASIARAGWAWGCSALDFDNDGFPDVYVANGMETRESVREYEGEFWLHDSHVATSTENPAAYVYLKNKVTRMRAHGESYGGYEKNRFYVNLGGREFVDVAHLFGLALEEDSRNVVAADLDGDGRVDLLVTSYERWPQVNQVLRVYHNEMAPGGNWITFQFKDEPGTSPVGVQVQVECNGVPAVQAIATGDSHRAEHPAQVHFGLGTATRIDRAEVRWPGGKRMSFTNLPANQHVRVSKEKSLDPLPGRGIQRDAGKD